MSKADSTTLAVVSKIIKWLIEKVKKSEEETGELKRRLDEVLSDEEITKLINVKFSEKQKSVVRSISLTSTSNKEPFLEENVVFNEEYGEEAVESNNNNNNTDMEISLHSNDELRSNGEFVNHNYSYEEELERIDTPRWRRVGNIRRSFSFKSGRRRQTIRRLEHQQEDEDLQLEQDVYSFFTFCRWHSKPFLVAFIITFGLQFSLVGILLADVIDPHNEQNPFNVPANIDGAVRIAQILALLIAIISQDDMRFGMEGMIQGMPTIFQGSRSFHRMTRIKWKLSYFVRFSVGIITMIGTFFLVIQADNVFDLFLNFSGIEFISSIDDLAFMLALKGYMGKKIARTAQKLVDARFSLHNIEKGYFTTKKVREMFLLLLVASLVLGSYSVIFFWQSSEKFLDEYIKVEFGDDVVPHLGLFNGCFKKIESKIIVHDGHVVYFQVGYEEDGGRIGYCDGTDFKGWTLFTGNDPCENKIAKSAEMMSYDLLDATFTNWYSSDGEPLDYVRLTSFDSDLDGKCRESVFMQTELCSILTIEEEFVGFGTETRDNAILVHARDYVRLADDLFFYGHPIFIQESPKSGDNEVQEDVIFFIGRRWVLARSSNLPLNSEVTEYAARKEEIVEFFRRNDFWIFNMLQNQAFAAFLSEATPISNQGTPLGLRWYDSRYPPQENPDQLAVVFPSANIGRQIDAVFTCGMCHSKSPCKYDGRCRADGTCDCKHDTTGKHCEIKPLGDGVCQPLFNNLKDQWDEGDCCAATCLDRYCGVGDIIDAFGQNISSITGEFTGFPHCKDPSMMAVSIQLNSTISDDFVQDGSFEAYTIDIRCRDGGQGFPFLRVSLDPSKTGKSNQTIHVSDQSGPCSIMFLGIQSWSQLSVSVQVFDETLPSGPIAIFKNEKIVTVDQSIELPPVYSVCLKNALKDTIDLNILYTGSYQDLAINWLHDEIYRGIDDCESIDYLKQRYALVALSFAEKAPKAWINSKDDHCWWPRVKCNDHKEVVDLTYDGATKGRLGGMLASELAMLTGLERIDVFGNHIRGRLPTGLAHLTSLVFIALSQNRLSGTIPSELGSLVPLSFLTLHENRLSGAIPSELGSLVKLSILTLGNNIISGTIPSELSALRVMKKLDLSRNDLIGNIPTEFGMLTSLTSLRLHKNRLSGTIPRSLSKMKSLAELRLSYNLLLHGTIPSELSSLKALKSLDIGYNKLSGRIPEGFYGLSNLTSISLNSNFLSGVVDTTIGSLSVLKVLQLQNNTFRGSLPSQIGLLSNLLFVDLSENTLGGFLPSEIGLLTDLQYLYLNNNEFHETIPSEINQLTNLRELRIYGNLFDDASVNDLMSDLNLISTPCEQTLVEIRITTDMWPSEASWQLLDREGNVSESGPGDYPVTFFEFKEEACVPSDICNFTISDSFGDGGTDILISRWNKIYFIDGSSYQTSASIDICE